MSRNLISLLFIIAQAVIINFGTAHGKNYDLDTEEDLVDGWTRVCTYYYEDEDNVCGTAVIPNDEYKFNKGFWSSCGDEENPLTCSLLLSSTTELDITRVGILAYMPEGVQNRVIISVTSEGGGTGEEDIRADGWTNIDDVNLWTNVSQYSPILQIEIRMEFNSRAVLDKVNFIGYDTGTESTQTSVDPTTEDPSTTEDTSSTTRDPANTSGDQSTTDEISSTTGDPDPTSTTEDPSTTEDIISSTTGDPDPTSTTGDPSTTEDISSTTGDPANTTGDQSTTDEISSTTGDPDPTSTTGDPSTTEDISSTTGDPDQTSTTEDPSTTEDISSTTGDPDPTSTTTGHPSTPEDPSKQTSIDTTTQELTTITGGQTSTGGSTVLTTTTGPLTTTTPNTTTPTIATTLSSTITTTKPNSGECLECKAIDSENHEWTTCAGEIGNRNCDEVLRNSTGKITWNCSHDGQFHKDGPNYEGCKSTWLIELVRESHEINTTSSALDYLSKLQTEMYGSQNDHNYFGTEMGTINEILGDLINKASNFSEDPVSILDVANMTAAVAGHLITTQQPWNHLNSNNRSQLVTNLLQTIEETSFLLTSKVNVSRSYEFGLFSENHFRVTSLAFLKLFSGLDNYQYPRKGTQNSVIKLPSGWVQYVKGEKIECVGMVMDPIYASFIMPGQFNKLGLESDADPKKVLNGQIMSFTIASNARTTTFRFPENETIEIDNVDFQFGGRGVQIMFKHVLETWGDEAYDMPRKLRFGEMPKAAQGSAQCVFWDTKNMSWSQKGCKLVSSTKLETICECNHLTSFAVLMDMHNYVGKNLGLEVLTLFLSTISIICLIFTILIITLITMARSQRTLITLHLSICLIIGNLLVLLVLDKDYLNLSNEACIASGIAIHYIFLAAFAWMGFQGIHLYRMVVNVYSIAKPRFLMIMQLSYGGPLFIIAITAIVGYLSEDPRTPPYGGELICWLNGPYILAFMGPVLIIVLINVVILSLSLWKSYRIRNRSTGVSQAGTRRRVSSLRTWIKGCLALTMLLGITWLSGCLMLAPAIPGIIAAYVFTILNASQGIFIFLFDCFFNDKVRQGIHRQYGRYLPVSLDTWLKTTSTPTQSPQTTSTSGKAMSRIQKNDASGISSSNSEDNSLRPLSPSRQRHIIGTTVEHIPPPYQSVHSQIPRPRLRYGIDGDVATETNSSVWEGHL